MAQRLAKHGSEAGYRAELKTGNVCERCRNGHRQFDRQYSKAFKRQGIKYTRYDVLDHLYKPGKASTKPEPGQARQAATGQDRARTGPEPEQSTEPGQDPPEPEQSTQSQTGPTLADRLAAGMRRLTVPGSAERYVNTDEMPDYLSTVDPDPEPQDPDSSPVADAEYVITRESMVIIEENLGTYLSVIGMTLEMVDPYCGPILAENLDNIVGRWSKVIARYPAAARIFMAKGGGTIMDWIGAIQATWPVLYAVYEHHLSHTIITEKGKVMRVVNNGQGPIEPTSPPIPDSYYTVG